MNRHEKCLKISVNVFQHHIKDGIMWKMGFLLGMQDWFDWTLDQSSVDLLYQRIKKGKKIWSSS